MSTQKTPILTLTRVAAEKITAHQAITATGAIAAAGEVAIGFSTTDAEMGDYFAVDAIGTSSGIASAAISAGDELEVAAEGKLATKTTGKRVGIALFDAATDEGFEVLICH